jgi:hypothetical protein
MRQRVCPLWVKSRLGCSLFRCPLQPRQQTFEVALPMSAKCQSATFASERAGALGHRVEATGLALRIRALAQLAEVEEPGAAAVKREAEEDWASTDGDKTPRPFPLGGGGMCSLALRGGRGAGPKVKRPDHGARERSPWSGWFLSGTWSLLEMHRGWSPRH